MNGFLRITMAAAIALATSSAWAQAAKTGKDVLNANTNQWLPPATDAKITGNGEADRWTGTFHAGGVAACDGCHVMHNAKNGAARSTKVAPWTNAVPAFLLQGSDQSSTCLMCHGDAMPGGNSKPYVIAQTSGVDVTPAMNYSPGGDFGWIMNGGKSRGERTGHNVVALDFGMAADSHLTAPGGTYTATTTGVAAFACSNCHDPHGRYRMETTDNTTWKWTGPIVGGGVSAINQPIFSSGSYGMLPKADGAVGAYRLLAGYGYSPASAVANPAPFANNPPVAVAPPAYNHSEAAGNEVRVAYGTGMSEWCQNCHSNIHMDNYTSGAMGASGLKHPAGNNAILKPGQFTVYNSYLSSGKFTGGQYTSLVPFENAKKISNSLADIDKLKSAANGTDTAGIFVASAQSNVMCLSCHRAHASAFDSMIRWNMDDTFITNSTVLVDTQNRGDAVLKAGYYGRGVSELGKYQRSMCNKCHGKD